MQQLSTKDVLAVFETVYQEVDGDEAWLRVVVGRMGAYLDAGLGAIGMMFDARGRDGVRIQSVVEVGPASFGDAARAVAEALQPLASTLLFHGPADFGALSLAPVMRKALRDDAAFGTFAALGFVDILALRISAGDGRGALILVPSRSAMALSSSDIALWRRLARHASAGLRMRHLAVAGCDPIREARRALVSDVAPRDPDAVRGVPGVFDADAAESSPEPSLRETPEHLWEGLLAGRWALVDVFEHDGNRIVFARRAQELAAPVVLLTARERQVAQLAALGYSNKLIANEMELSVSTVALYLSRAARKHGVSSRVALIRATKQFEAAPSSGVAPPANQDLRIPHGEVG